MPRPSRSLRGIREVPPARLASNRGIALSPLRERCPGVIPVYEQYECLELVLFGGAVQRVALEWKEGST